jgi:hypothetical protein
MFELSEYALQEIGTIFINMMKKKIKEKIYPYGNPKKRDGDKYASGNLYNSLTATVQNTPNGPELTITYADYFKYVNLGRKPGVGLVPIPAILDWIKIRGIRPRDKKGRFIRNTEKNQLGLAFAIRKNIYKFGIRPANIYDKGLDSLADVFDNPPAELREAYNDLYAAIENDVYNFVEANIKEIEVQRITITDE